MPVSSPHDLDSPSPPPFKRHEPVIMPDPWNGSLAYRPPLAPVHAPSKGIDADVDRQLSLDDPDVRLAAEALGDLRADFVSTPPEPCSSPDRTSQSPRPEPLLSLLTTSHPLVASTIGGASSAYGGAKNLSPRFKSGAEYVEGYLTPIANTVNSVGRVTGVEGGVRWFLGASRRHAAPDPEVGGYSHKRRKVCDGDVDLPGASLNLWSADPHRFDHRSPRRLSSTSTVDTLPAYDELRSPAYTETTGSQAAPRPGPWQSRLMLSTSGLSVSMSAESLRSLKYCLRWLRWTNDHMGRVIGTLKATIEEYEKTRPQASPTPPEADAPATSPEPGPEPSRLELINRINTLKSDILKTLQNTIETVSKYAGGALPENARVLVRRHLTSLPQRFRIATMSTDGGEGRDAESAISEGAQKVLLLAKEGLDMVTQVSGVVDGTIMSAEEWCERMDGTRQSPTDEEDQSGASQQEPGSGGVKMA
ncbi:hypothetical protein XA68_13261 [Ophiocordyceps unilateralis]|uniref:Clock-controlled protein 8 n=1 Tax=Ophiocordyceps unilateralis TaxID=268505 RepID=A0A2A9PNS6_OPHUN|nr:hypothetical protein XA68_13261 [Ophiocordyceps unilateralis]